MDGAISRDSFLCGDPSVELSSNRTAMSFERTRVSMDRTLMSVIRTSLSMIGFGFTIYQVFRSMAASIRPGLHPDTAPRNFALALVLLGVGMLLLGIVNHALAMGRLHRRRERMLDLGLLRHSEPHHPTMVWLVALILLLIGLCSIASVAFRAGPFS